MRRLDSCICIIVKYSGQSFDDCQKCFAFTLCVHESGAVIESSKVIQSSQSFLHHSHARCTVNTGGEHNNPTDQTGNSRCSVTSSSSSHPHSLPTRPTIPHGPPPPTFLCVGEALRGDYGDSHSSWARQSLGGVDETCLLFVCSFTQSAGWRSRALLAIAHLCFVCVRSLAFAEGGCATEGNQPGPFRFCFGRCRVNMIYSYGRHSVGFLCQSTKKAIIQSFRRVTSYT
jgi:hypothetical protein